jgi:hypothetical protein
MPESTRRKYVRNPDRPVAAVQLALETDGFVYRKWGGEQRAKRDDWLVNNDGDVYTVDADVFARTYRPVDRSKNPCAYVKTTPIWAEQATEAGSVKTKEGATQYEAGDYIVSNQPDGSDNYAITSNKFHELYVLASEDG